MPAFLGLLLVIAVLIEPYLIRRQVAGAALGLAPRQAAAAGLRDRRRRHRGRADQGRDGDRQGAVGAPGFGKFLARRDALAIILTVLLWLVGLSLRPDYWWNLPNTFAILLNYTELALITVGLTYVIAAGDIDLSVGAVLALAGSTAAYCLKVLGARSDDGRGRWACSPACCRRGQRARSPSASGCRPSSPRSACSTSPAASPPGSSPASSSPAGPRATT